MASRPEPASLHLGIVAGIGIVAGSGRLPAHLLASVRAADHEAVVVCVCKDPDPALRAGAYRFQQTSPGQLRKIIKAFHQNGVSDVVLIGGVQKAEVFHPFRFDTLALKVLAQNRRRGDRSLLKAIAVTFEENGLRVLDQRIYLDGLLPRPGVLTRKQPNLPLQHDIDYGIQVARQVAAMDVGQTVVVKDGVIVAVEAVEGTNTTIRRGAELAGRGIVVTKAAHPDHDFRFDVPTVGPETIQLLKEVQASALAIEAERSFLVDRETTLRMANEAGICVTALGN